jgi:hypothetical protein
MVLLTLDSIRKVFLDVIKGKMSFEQASVWASYMIEKDEIGLLEITPKENISKIFSALTYLTGLDLTEPNGEYFHSISNVQDEYNKIFNNL